MNRVSDCFNRYISVKHGEPLSPLLFVVFINAMVSELERENLTAFTINQMQIFMLLFADDTVLFSESPADVQLMLDNLYTYCRKMEYHCQHRQNQKEW